MKGDGTDDTDDVSRLDYILQRMTTGVSVSILTFLGMVIVNKVPHYRVTKLGPDKHTYVHIVCGPNFDTRS